MARAEEELRRTEITQPAVLTVDIALTNLLGEYGIAPDMVMGHSLGEYGALVAAGALSFEAALEAVSARGRGMASLKLGDPGAMAAVIAPLAEVEEVVAATDGYVALANVNSTHQVVLGGATEAVGRAVAALKERGHQAFALPVSHAFHTEIVAPASEPLRAALQRLGLRAPALPIVANVDGELYPTGDDVQERMLDLLARQVASPVQFVKGLHTLYDAGRAGLRRGRAQARAAGLRLRRARRRRGPQPRHQPSQGRRRAVVQRRAVRLWAAGLGAGLEPAAAVDVALRAGATAQQPAAPRHAGARSGRRRLRRARAPVRRVPRARPRADGCVRRRTGADHGAGGRHGRRPGPPGRRAALRRRQRRPRAGRRAGHRRHPGPRAARDARQARHPAGQGRRRQRRASRPSTDVDDVIKLAARAGAFDLGEEFGVDADRLHALGRDTQLAIAAGIDALRDAGIPLVQHYKTTTTGTQLPDRWSLPDELRDDTGVIFASAFPGLEEMTDEVARQTTDRMRRERLDALESLRARMVDHDGTDAVVLAEVDRRIHDLSRQLEEEPYAFDRRFLFRVLSMGHSQFAELIGARGPNTQINSACASTTQAVALAEDWIRVGRCRRVVVVAADDATSDVLLGWLGAGLPGLGRRRHRRGRRGRRAAVRRAPPRDDHRDGRRGHRRGERRRPRASAA